MSGFPPFFPYFVVRQNFLFAFSGFSWLLHKWRGRLSVTSENNLPRFQPNAPVALMNTGNIGKLFSELTLSLHCHLHTASNQKLKDQRCPVFDHWKETLLANSRWGRSGTRLHRANLWRWPASLWWCLSSLAPELSVARLQGWAASPSPHTPSEPSSPSPHSPEQHQRHLNEDCTIATGALVSFPSPHPISHHLNHPGKQD